MSLWDQLNDDEQRYLDGYDFDPQQFEALRQRFLAGDLDPARHGIRGTIEAAPPSAYPPLPAQGSSAYREFVALGEDALRRGEVGVVILNGGMATRFGGGVKGTLEVFDGLSFLQLKRDALEIQRQCYAAPIPLLLMNSFATDVPTKAHLQPHGGGGSATGQPDCFVQNIGVRLTPEGAVFRDAEGQASFYGTGHGDLGEAINRGTLQRFLDEGGCYLLMANVDNLLADLDPLLLGAHIRSGRLITVEVTPKLADDVGGVPALVNGSLQIVETFRCPGFDHHAVPVLNTNTLWFSVEALERPTALPYYAVGKTVDGAQAVQFERLVGEMTAFHSTHAVCVPRAGANSRFCPLKQPEDLHRHRGFLRETLAKRRSERQSCQ